MLHNIPNSNIPHNKKTLVISIKKTKSSRYFIQTFFKKRFTEILKSNIIHTYVLFNIREN